MTVERFARCQGSGDIMRAIAFSDALIYGGLIIAGTKGQNRWALGTTALARVPHTASRHGTLGTKFISRPTGMENDPEIHSNTCGGDIWSVSRHSGDITNNYQHHVFTKHPSEPLDADLGSESCESPRHQKWRRSRCCNRVRGAARDGVRWGIALYGAIVSSRKRPPTQQKLPKESSDAAQDGSPRPAGLRTLPRPEPAERWRAHVGATHRANGLRSGWARTS